MFDWKKFFNDFADRYYAVPDFNNKDHVYALQNYLIEQGMLVEDVDYAIKTLLGEAFPRPKNAWNEREIHLKDEEERVAEGEGKFSARAQSGKVSTFGSKEARDAAIQKGTHTKVDKDSEDPETGGEDEGEKDDAFTDKKYDTHRQNFVNGINRVLPRIPFESDEEKEIFTSVIEKIKNNQLEFSDEEKQAVAKYIGKSDSDRVAKLYIATTAPRDFADKSNREQINYKSRDKNVNGPEYMDAIAKSLDLPTAAAQATKAKSGELVTSKVRGKDLSPTEINKSADVLVSRITDSKGNVVKVNFGKSSHNVVSMPDKQKLVDTFIKRGMDAKKAELRARKVRNSIRKHNEFLLDLSKDRESFKVATMVEGADPSTPEGRKKILIEYPRKLAKIFTSIVEKSPDGITSEEKKVMGMLKNLDSNLSPEEYEKDCLNVMHELLENPSLVSGSADLAESLIALIQIKKGIEVYFPSDVTYKVGDMISLGSVEDLDPNDSDYYNKVADAASSIIVTVEEEGPNSVKLNQGAASSMEEKMRMTEFGDKETRQVLTDAISTHNDLFKTDSPDLDLVDKKVEAVKQHAIKLGLTSTETDKITENAKKQSANWIKLWKAKTPKGTQNWTEEDWENCQDALVRYGEMQSLIAVVNNKDMVYQKFTNFRIHNKSKEAELQRTDGVNCLGTVKPAPNMGFKYTKPGVAIPNNTYPSRIGNSCYDKKKG